MFECLGERLAGRVFTEKSVRSMEGMVRTTKIDSESWPQTIEVMHGEETMHGCLSSPQTPYKVKIVWKLSQE